MKRRIAQERIKRFQKILQENKIDIDVALFTRRENTIYFTGGITQVECIAVIIPKEGDPAVITLWLDAPYVAENSGIEKVFGYHFPSNNLGKKVVEVLKTEFGLKAPKIKIGTERYFMDFYLYNELKKGFPKIEFIDLSEIIYKVRAVKEPREINYNIKKASAIVVRGMEAAINSVKPGISEVEVLAEAEYAMRKAGSEGSNFRMQVLAGSERQLLTHPYASNNKIKNNQTVVIHLGATYMGYSAKMCRTVAVGKVPEKTKEIYEVILDAQTTAINALKPGKLASEVFNAAYEVVRKAGYGNYFLDVIGYGIGLRQSEFYPIIKKNSEHRIESNMVVGLLLPTIYVKNYGGPRVTDVIQVTEDGPRILTKYPRELIEL
ncbi:Xaa-Pro peptidase family protein [Thermococcus sp. LS2]|uniref:M24 family metallopeptidase n=1 Tax=Thermococcus sp. LS2 TaxID=1638260 RepID=UPI00143990CB|nr:Xaa-Pro peptidase family protein [Thermococcus sp. LS2]NJE13174.1 aminopeptidase P family protein [Thermococcus sp. LS2]